MPKRISKSRRKSPAKSGDTKPPKAELTNESPVPPPGTGFIPQPSTGQLRLAFDFGLLCAEYHWFRSQALVTFDFAYWQIALERLLELRAMACPAFPADQSGLVYRLLNARSEAASSVKRIEFPSREQSDYLESILDGRDTQGLDAVIESLEDLAGDTVSEVLTTLRNALGSDHEQVGVVELGLTVGHAEYPKRVIPLMIEIAPAAVEAPHNQSEAEHLHAQPVHRQRNPRGAKYPKGGPTGAARTPFSERRTFRRSASAKQASDRRPSEPRARPSQVGFRLMAKCSAVPETWHAAFAIQWRICFPELPVPQTDDIIAAKTGAIGRLVESIRENLKSIDERRGLSAWPPDGGWHSRPNQFAVLGKTYDLPASLWRGLDLLIARRGPVLQRDLQRAIWQDDQQQGKWDSKQLRGWKPRLIERLTELLKIPEDVVLIRTNPGRDGTYELISAEALEPLLGVSANAP